MNQKEFTAKIYKQKSPNQEIQSISAFSIYWQRQIFHGNNYQILLEQLEQAGIRIPYSCRVGICGYCRIKLVEGEVRTLKKSNTDSDGTILCCSCVPRTSLQLESYVDNIT